MNTSVVIGEGSYGCVHKPSLKCKKKNIDYDNKISKIMKKDNAVIEMKEYKKISNIDKNNEFYLGKPIKCNVDNIKSNIDSIAKCNKNGKKFIDQIENLSLLVMEDGGVNLEEYANEILKLPVNENNKNNIELFWIEAQRILYGLSIFLKNEIIHHDLKPQNIVYNKKTNRLNFIDFGLMRKKREIISSSKKSDYGLSRFHWSFPFETELYNKTHFLKFSNLEEEKKIKFFDEMLLHFNTSKNSKILAIKSFLYYITNKNLTQQQNSDYIKIILQDYIHMMVNINDNKYEDFLNKSVNTIDIFGVGIAFYYVFINCLAFLEEDLIEEFSYLFYKMICLDVNKRITIDPLLSQYESILDKSGLMKKHNKYFDNHVLKDGVPETKPIEDLLNSLTLNDDISKKELQNVVNIEIKDCPPEKEYNHITRRCVKKCKEGYSRNEKGRCVKTNRTRKIK